MARLAWRIRSIRTRTDRSNPSPCRRTARFWPGVTSPASAAKLAPASPVSMRRPAWLIRSMGTRAAMSLQSQSRRTARFWRAVFSRASAGKPATISRGSMARPAWRIRSTRTRMVLPSTRSRCRRTGRFWWVAPSTEPTASVDSYGITSRGSMVRAVWQTRSIRMRLVMSIRLRCRRTARFWWEALSAEPAA